MQQRRRLAFRTVRIKQDQRPAVSASLKKKHLKISRAWQDSLAVSESLVLVSNSHFQYWEVRKAGVPQVGEVYPPHAAESSLLLHNSLFINIFCKSSFVWSCHFLV